jgi:hypothetical protein
MVIVGRNQYGNVEGSISVLEIGKTVQYWKGSASQKVRDVIPWSGHNDA